MVLVGYESISSNYRLYDPVTKKISTSKDVKNNDEQSSTINKNNYTTLLLMDLHINREDSDTDDHKTESEENS